MAQDATTTANALNAFIGAAQSGLNVIKSADPGQFSTSSAVPSSSATPSITSSPTPAATTSAPAASSTAPPAHHGLSTGAKIGIIVGAIAAAIFLLGLIIGLCCCCLRRRRHRRAPNAISEEEYKQLQSSHAGGSRSQAGYVPNTSSRNMTQDQSAAPLMAGAAAHHRSSSGAPSLSQHPALRDGHHYGRDAAVSGAGGVAAYELGKHRHEPVSGQKENPFVPAPPITRRPVPAPQSRLLAGGEPAIYPQNQRLQKGSASHSRSNSQPQPEASTGATGATGLPTSNDPDRPPTPFGLAAFGQPADKKVEPNQIEPPSPAQRRSLHEHESNHPDLYMAAVSATDHQPEAPFKRRSDGYSTPPEVPSRSPHRRPAPLADANNSSSYSTSTSTTTEAAERYQQQYDPYRPANLSHSQRDSLPPWEQHQYRYSENSTPPTSGTPRTPPVPSTEQLEISEPRPRRHSHSPRRQSLSNDGNRTKSRSPGATGINGQPRRLRFEDLQSSKPADPYHAQGRNSDYMDEDDGYNHIRWSQGVGEAL